MYIICFQLKITPREDRITMEFKGSESYIASEQLMQSVNVAIALEKPLLVKGEPGTGKTMLAVAISEALGKDLIIWNIKSTTKAADGLYVYDAVKRLYDSQFSEGGVDDIKKYISLGKLGEAFTAEEQVVLLIDEIDKADIEFPNDLLWELDKMEFFIPETGETVTAKHRPVVIITSNAEKDLPDAFLRRCVFHYIDFPDEALMRQIVRTHLGDVDRDLLDQAMEVLYRLRSVKEIQKKPSTSEVIDWISAMTIGGLDPRQMNLNLDIPLLGTLLKKNEDIDTLKKQMENKYYGGWAR